MTEQGDERGMDIPKTLATIGVKAPRLVMNLGLSYLRFKRGANRATKVFVKELESGGMPSEKARKLGAAYASDISVRKFLGQTGAGGLQGVRLR